MEFDVSKVYTAVNAEELKPGSKLITADNLSDLKAQVSADSPHILSLTSIKESEESLYRFECEDGNEYALAYLVEEPETLKWTDLKVGDIIYHDIDKVTAMVTRIDEDESKSHVYISSHVVDDDELTQWRKVGE